MKNDVDKIKEELKENRLGKIEKSLGELIKNNGFINRWIGETDKSIKYLLALEESSVDINDMLDLISASGKDSISKDEMEKILKNIKPIRDKRAEEFAKSVDSKNK